MPIRNRFRLLLIVSLAANLFLGGVFAGGFIEAWRQDPEPSHGRPPPFRLHMGGMLERLPEDARGQAHDVMERHRGRMRGSVGEMRQARREVAAALAAEPFEPNRLETALAELRRRGGAAQAAMHGAMAELAGDLGPEARRALAEGLAHRRHRQPRHRRPSPPRD